MNALMGNMIRFIEAYAANFDDSVTCDMLTPYCIRIRRRIRSRGRIRDMESGECIEGDIFTGATIGILDIYPKSMKYHALIPNVRGDVFLPWKTGLKKLIKDYVL